MSQLSGLNYNIGGALPFQSGGNPMLGVAQLGAGLGMPAGAVQGLNTLAQQYGQSYQSALSQNQTQYGNILKGYQQLMGNQQAQQGAIGQGYTNLQNQVMGDISGIGASELQAIKDAYAQQSGSLQQSMINRGLGNATVSDSMQRGLTLDSQKAQVALANQMAQLTAGYRSNLGLAGLGYQNQANMQNTALGAQQLGWMNSVNMPYPNPGEYNALFGQAGMQNQANQDRALQQQLMQARRNPFGGGGGGAGAGQITYGPHANLGAGWDMAGAGGGGGGYGGGGGFMGGGNVAGPMLGSPYGGPAGQSVFAGQGNLQYDMAGNVVGSGGGGGGGGIPSWMTQPNTGGYDPMTGMPTGGGDVWDQNPWGGLGDVGGGAIDQNSYDPNFNYGGFGGGGPGGYGPLAMDPSLINPTYGGTGAGGYSPLTQPYVPSGGGGGGLDYIDPYSNPLSNMAYQDTSGGYGGYVDNSGGGGYDYSGYA